MATNSKEFIAEQQAFAEGLGTTVETLQKTIDGLVVDQKTMSEIIKRLQESPGSFSAEDQTGVDKLQANNTATLTKLTAAAAALKALDDMTPPVPPVTS